MVGILQRLEHGICEHCGDSPEEKKISRDLDKILCSKCWSELHATSHCKNCQKPFDYPKGEPTPDYGDCCRYKMKPCAACKETFCSHDGRDAYCKPCQIRGKANDFWRTVPPLYRKSKYEMLPCRVSSDVTLSWKPGENGHSGLFIHGKSRTGKTRTGYLVALGFVRQELTATVIRGQELARQIVELSCSEPGSLGTFLDEVKGSGVLTIDEVDKMGFSARVVSEFFNLLESRIAAERITILISNLRLDEFCMRLPAEYRDPVEQRMLEFFLPVAFE